MRQIPVKLPPSFEAAIGYARGQRWVAFFWEPCGDEAMFDDGYCSADGNWFAFLELIRHPAVKPWVADYDFGSSDSEAKHWLLCDLETREVYAGDVAEVRKFLARDIPQGAPPVSLSPEEWKEAIEKITQELREVPAPSMEVIHEKMRQDAEMLDKLKLELDMMLQSK